MCERAGSCQRVGIPLCSSDRQNFASSRCCRLELLRARLPRLFGVFANASTKFTQPSLKPSLLGPHPNRGGGSLSPVPPSRNVASQTTNSGQTPTPPVGAQLSVHTR